MEVTLLIVGAIFIFLLTRRWFWKIALFFGGLASLFAMIASIFHFQVLAAIGFFILMVICSFAYQAISSE